MACCKRLPGGAPGREDGEQNILKISGRYVGVGSLHNLFDSCGYLDISISSIENACMNFSKKQLFSSKKKFLTFGGYFYLCILPILPSYSFQQ